MARVVLRSSRTATVLLGVLGLQACLAVPEEPEPVPCPDDDTASVAEGRCYRKLAAGGSWLTGREACVAIGPDYDLVVISAEGENQIVSQLAEAEHRVWLGLGEPADGEGANDNDFRWVDGSSDAAFDMWADGEPQGGPGRQCAFMDLFVDGRWLDGDCPEGGSGTYLPICEGPT